MTASLRRHRAALYTYSDSGSNGEISATYTLAGTWWASKAMPNGREVTTGMKPEHRVDAILGFSSHAPVAVDSLVLLESVQYLVRAILDRDHGRDDVQVYAEKSLDTFTLVP